MPNEIRPGHWLEDNLKDPEFRRLYEEELRKEATLDNSGVDKIALDRTG
ncbi:MAG: hypothetical protein WC551_08685 [Patescibacteria group bacterium]